MVSRWQDTGLGEAIGMAGRHGRMRSCSSRLGRILLGPTNAVLQYTSMTGSAKWKQVST